MKTVICDATELRPGDMRSAAIGQIPIVVIRTELGTLHGLFDRCLHMGGPLSKGRLLRAQSGNSCGHYVEETGRFVVKCPWHGYEYDVSTGSTLFDARVRIRTFTVREESGQVVAETDEREA